MLAGSRQLKLRPKKQRASRVDAHAREPTQNRRRRRPLMRLRKATEFRTRGNSDDAGAAAEISPGVSTAGIFQKAARHDDGTGVERDAAREMTLVGMPLDERFGAES